MNRSQLKKEIIADEGMVKHIYEDHLGYPTFGVGHLITEKDPEWKKSLGTEVSEERVHECLEKDLDIVLKDCKILYPDFDDLPEEVQHIVANIQKKLTAGIHIVFWLVLCLIELEKELSMYEQSRIKISQLLSALVCLAIIAVEVL